MINPYYNPQQFPQMQNVNQPNTSNIIWVQGEAGAKSYLVAPNTTVPLWDSENQIIYLKSADASGMPSIRIIDYKVRDMKQNSPIEPLNVNHEEYATKEDLEALRGEIRSLKEQYSRVPKQVHEQKRKGEGKLC